MTNETSALVLENQKKKFRSINRIYDLTKDMEKNIDDGDIEALEMTVEFRQKQIEACIFTDAENEKLRNGMESEESVRYFRLTHLQETEPEFRDDTEREIYAMTVRIASQLKKVREYDKRFTERFVRNKGDEGRASP